MTQVNKIPDNTSSTQNVNSTSTESSKTARDEKTTLENQAKKDGEGDTFTKTTQKLKPKKLEGFWGLVQSIFGQKVGTLRSGVEIQYSKAPIVYSETKDGITKDVISGDELYILGTDKDDKLVVKGSKNEIDLKGGKDSIVLEGSDSDISLKDGNDSIILKGSSNDINSNEGNNIVDVQGSSNDVNLKLEGKDGLFTFWGSPNNIVNVQGSNNDISGGENSEVTIKGDKNEIHTNLNEKQISIEGGNKNIIKDEQHSSTKTGVVSSGKMTTTTHHSLTEPLNEVIEASKEPVDTLGPFEMQRIYGINNEDLDEIAKFKEDKITDKGTDTQLYLP